MRSIFITGGGGYIGGRLARFLSDKTGCRVIIGSRRLAQASGGTNYTYSEIDLSYSGDTVALLAKKLQQVDCIIHLAALGDREAQQDPLMANDINVSGTIKLLEAAKKAAVKRFIYLSTAHIYGTPFIGEVSEATLPRPVSSYAITHRSAEDYVVAADAQKQIQGFVLRLSNSFGFPESAATNCHRLLVNDVCRQVIYDKKIVLHSSGQQYRDFIAMSDVCRAIAHFIDVKEELFGESIFNLGGDAAIRVIDIVNLVAARAKALFGYTVSVHISQDNAHQESASFVYRIDKLKQTGFLLSKDINGEIDRTLLWYQKAFSEGVEL